MREWLFWKWPVVLRLASCSLRCPPASRDAEERTRQRRERAVEREMQAVEVLDDALREAKWRLPMSSGEGETSKTAIFAAHDAWQDGYFRAAGLIRDDELIERYQAAGWALLSALLDEGRVPGGADLWIVGRAIDSARGGFAAFLLGEPLPPATFPAKAEAKALARMTPKGRDYEALSQWFLEHPDPADGDVGQISGR